MATTLPGYCPIFTHIDSLMFSSPHWLKMYVLCRQIFLCISLVVSYREICYSQNIPHSDSLEYQSQLELFDDVIGIENTELINGPKYTMPFQVSGTHPFYNSSIGATGSLTFIGQPYFNLTLLYDIYTDELIVQQLRAAGTRDLIKLYKVNVGSFRIHDHTFRNYQGFNAQNLGIASGFYDVLYENAVFTLLVKRKKDTRVEMGLVQYENEDQYLFIRQGRKATPFRGMKNFYQVLGDKKLSSELRSLVSKYDLKIKKNEADLIATARYCDTILNKQK
jgi:hypothetical protein